MYNFCSFFFIFFIYSVAGFLVELIFCTIAEKKIILNRGFLIGPYCPIYGTAAVIMTFSLRRYIEDPIVVFSMGALISTTTEYITSYVMEKLFKTRWWDYTHESFNVNGRVCLKNSVLFGIGSLFIIYLSDKWLVNLINVFDRNLFMVINVAIMVVFIVDVVISTNLIFKLRRNSELAKRDMTDEIKERVKMELSKNILLTKRLLNSFPKVYENIRTTIKSIDKAKFSRKIKDKINKR